MTKQLRIDIATQQLICYQADLEVNRYWVSTAKNGPGEICGSGCTPRGLHSIRLKIGTDCPENTVFVGRRPTGEYYSDRLAAQEPQRDWILTRILWLTGRESGFNRGGQVDTLRRYIYIHGTPNREPMGVALSHGCIRMHNQDLIPLFDWAVLGTPVEIVA
jgi:hypothetical protein